MYMRALLRVYTMYVHICIVDMYMHACMDIHEGPWACSGGSFVGSNPSKECFTVIKA